MPKNCILGLKAQGSIWVAFFDDQALGVFGIQRVETLPGPTPSPEHS